MSETYLTVGATNSAIKVVLKSINPYRGVGVTRLLFTFEITSKQQAVVGGHLWLSGQVDLLSLPGRTMRYLASFLPLQQPIPIPQLGMDQRLQLTLEVSEHQVQLIEADREAGIELYLHLSGYAVHDGQQSVVSEGQFTHDIGQSDWLTMLRQMGYRRRLLLELESPDPQAHPDLAGAIDYYLQAQRHFSEGEWRLSVESLRQSLAAVVGKKADDEEQEAEIQDALKTQRRDARSNQVGYEPRLELVRQATEFMCDLGAHPEIAETRRHHAYGVLMAVGGLLHAIGNT